MHKLKRYFQISLAVSRIVRLILPHSLDDVLSYSYRARLPEDPAQGSMLNKGQEHCHGGRASSADQKRRYRHRGVAMTYTSQIKAPFSDIFDKFTDLAATMRSIYHFFGSPVATAANVLFDPRAVYDSVNHRASGPSDQARQVSLSAWNCNPSTPPGGGVNFIISPRGITALARP
jgi:hypothetical protein